MPYLICVLLAPSPGQGLCVLPAGLDPKLSDAGFLSEASFLQFCDHTTMLRFLREHGSLCICGHVKNSFGSLSFHLVVCISPTNCKRLTGPPNHVFKGLSAQAFGQAVGPCWEILGTLPGCVLTLPPGGCGQVLHSMSSVYRSKLNCDIFYYE